MFSRLTNLIDDLGGGIAGLLNLIGGLALVALIPSFSWLVFGRYVLNETPTWVEQVSLILIVLITFPVAAAGMRDNSHLSVSFFRDALPPKIAAMLAALSYAGMAWFGYWMLIGGLDLAAFNWAKNDADHSYFRWVAFRADGSLRGRDHVLQRGAYFQDHCRLAEDRTCQHLSRRLA